MKKIILFLFLLVASFLRAQQPADLAKYYQQLKSQGFSDAQIKQLAEENGYSIDDLLASNTNATSKQEKEEPSQNLNSDFSSQSSGANPSSSNAELRIFGSQYFNNIEYNFSPQINIATPPNYELGPGDGISIALWGASEVGYQQNINREGSITIEGVGPIFLSGYTISQAKTRVKKALSKIYNGLYSEVENEKVNIDLSLSSSRSVFVNIIGEVQTPGLYTLNGMSSPIHALYSAGGVSNNGSYRNIEVVRGGKVISNLDLYDYFSSGVLQTLFLKDQDVIRVPNYKKRVQLTGEVKFRGLFELRSGETLSDLFEYSGGLGPKALKESFLIERVEGASYKSFNVNAQNEALEPGDKVYVYSISEEKNNTVSIEGEVLIPGSYSLKTIFTVADLIKASKGFTQEAYLEYGSLFRKQPNGVTQMISIGLISDQYNKNLQEPLKENDVLRIYNKSKFFPFEKVRIVGEVISPSTYNFYQGMSLQDLIALAGGLSSSKGKLDITIKSKDPNSNDYIISNSISSYELEKNSSTLLQPDDIVSVILKNNFSATTIKISGEVVNPGVYIESKSLNSITNVIEQAGGFTQFASKDAVYIKRRNNSFEIEKLLDESLSRGSINNEVFFIPVENLNQPYLFEDGDELIVDGYSEDIELVGEVIKPSIVKFKSTKLKYYLAKSGITSKGSKKQILVIYPNKDVSSSSSFLGFNKFPKVKPGSQIVVGKKPERNKISTQELIGITSGLSTLIIVLSTFLSSP